MKLTGLEATFIRWYQRLASDEERKINPQWPVGYVIDCFQEVVSLREAHGIHFICPKCFNSDGRHFIQVFFVGSPVPQHLGKNKAGKTIRWKTTGTSLFDLSLQPSIEVQVGCLWHGFVTNGDAH